ncbi:MAG: hypothetical protein PUK02_05990, partial [Parabacteroides sp.]|nr:hypothetical protein [Parabacteroides sp.]
TLRLYCRKASAMDKWKALRIDNSIGTDFINGRWTMDNACRGAACCAAIPMRQDKTTGSTINIFVILLIVIGLCEMSL